MTTQSKRWQTRIDISEEVVNADIDTRPIQEIVYVYGETIDQLRQAAREYLFTRKPKSFSNVGDHLAGQFEYYYQEGTTSGQEEDGWVRYDTELIGRKNQRDIYCPPEKMESFEEVVEHFVQVAFIPEKGPSYTSKAFVGSDIRLPLLERIMRETEEYLINDLIQRGWHIIALEYKGELSLTGELTNRKAVFVMGHPEVQAATITLNSYYYLNRDLAPLDPEKC